MLNNLFGTKPLPEATPIATPVEAINVTPVVTEKTSISESIKGFFSRAHNAVEQMQTHQKNLVGMVKAALLDGEYLAQQIPLSLKDTDVKTVLQYHHDLNNRPTVDAVKTDSFIMLKGLLKEDRISALIKKGTTALSTKKGGVAHAEQVLDQTLLEGAQKGVNKALQARVLTDADKGAFLSDAVSALQTSLNDGSASPEQVIEEVRKLTADTVLGADAQQGKIGSQLANITAQAEQTIVDTEKNLLMEEIDGNYGVQNEKIDLIQSLLAQIEALKGSNDSNVENSASVNQEIQGLADQIVELVKEIDENTEMSTAHIRNPLSKNSNPSIAKELKSLLTYDLDRADKLIGEIIVKANAPVVEKLQDIQNGRSTSRKVYDAVVGSKENTILSKDAATKARVAVLGRSINAFEAKLAAKVEAASARTWSQFGRDALSSINPFKAGPSAGEQLENAENALNEFLGDETVQSAIRGYEQLATALNHTEKKQFFIFDKSRKAAAEKIAVELDAHITNNIAIFETRQELIKTRDEAELSVAALNQQSEEAEDEDFVIAQVSVSL